MTDITELAQSLKAVAMKATPGQWVAFTHADSRTFSVHTPDDKRCGDVIKWAGFDGQRKAKANAEFIAMANPANVRALVEALEKAQQQTTESENRVRKQNRHICELFDDNTALRQRIADLEESHAQVIQSRDHYKRISEEGLKQLAESRTVTVKLPEPFRLAKSSSGLTYYYADEVDAAITAAGIKVEAE